MSYAADRQWSDQFIPSIRSIVGPYLLEPAPFEVDTKQATDLVVLRARDHMIACRVRRPGYADSYPYDFTIRAQRDNGVKTELEKLVDGWGDWFFYGHADRGNRGFARWMLLDLHVWRASLIRHRDKIRSRMVANGDGTHFIPFDVRQFPEELVIGWSHPIARQAELLMVEQ